MGVMTSRDFEEVTGADVSFRTGVDHLNGELAAYAISRVRHRAGVRGAEQGLLVLFPGPARLKHGSHSGSAVLQFDNGDPSSCFHIDAVVGVFKAADFD